MDIEYMIQKLEEKNNLEKIGTEEDIKKEREEKQVPTQKANKCASLFDFIKMVSKVMKNTMKEVSFEMDEGSRPIIDQAVTINEPRIYYQLLSRKLVPEDTKPRLRESGIKEQTEDNSFRYVSIYGQKFNCIVQFDIMCPKTSVNQTADEVMNNFEEMLINYTHYFKKNGVSELLFDMQTTDHNLDAYRQVCSVRSIQYKVTIEKLTKVYNGEIFGIDN